MFLFVRDSICGAQGLLRALSLVITSKVAQGTQWSTGH